jgi:ubiquinone biosynthesis protein COQ4
METDMACDMAKSDHERQDREYMEGPARPLEQFGSVLLTSSKFLNSAAMRDIYAQEGLRMDGRDVSAAKEVGKAVKAFAELTDMEDVRAKLEAEKQINPVFRAWLEKRSLSDFTDAELKACGPGTIGRVLHDYLIRTGFDLNHSRKDLTPVDDYTFILKQRSMGHDLEHVVTGFEPNPIAEYAQIVCNLRSLHGFFTPAFAAEMTGMFGFIFSTAAMKVNLHYPELMGAFLDAARWGAEMGEKMTRPLLVTDWRDFLHWTVEDVRRDFNIQNVPPPGLWDSSAKILNT